MCPECMHALSAKDLIPVVSWIFLRGKCRYCNTRIHWQYPVVEAVTSIAFGLSAFVLAPANLVGVILFMLWLLLLSMLIILAVYDARWMLLPDKIMWPAIGVAAMIVLIQALVAHSFLALRGPSLAAIIFGGAFLALVVLSRGRAMGGGDIKLVFLMGLVLGLKSALLALIIAFDVAAIVGITLILLKKRGRRDMIPFGPFLVLATVMAYLYGAQIIQWYLHLNGLAS
jgi:leader peptidase (prepilin peptidase)/N-methyltransferase